LRLLAGAHVEFDKKRLAPLATGVRRANSTLISTLVTLLDAGNYVIGLPDHVHTVAE
jgi:hypothetical protein